MAQKTTKSSEKTNVRRIKATDDVKPEKVEKVTKSSTAVKKNEKIETTSESKNLLVALGEYFKGAWYELKQVRWPSRSATWGMTLAVLVFTAIFVVLILLLDAGFKWIFEQFLK